MAAHLEDIVPTVEVFSAKPKGLATDKICRQHQGVDGPAAVALQGLEERATLLGQEREFVAPDRPRRPRRCRDVSNRQLSANCLVQALSENRMDRVHRRMGEPSVWLSREHAFQVFDREACETLLFRGRKVEEHRDGEVDGGAGGVLEAFDVAGLSL